MTGKMKLNQLSDNAGANQPRKRVGRGAGSGTGKTSGSGQKGQKSRSGVAIKGFEGGQMPLHRRLPKRGFNNIFRKNRETLGLGRIQTALDDKKVDGAKTLTAALLAEAGVIKTPADGIRLVANGELNANIKIEVAGASKAAVAAVEKAGGNVVVTVKPKVPRNRKSSRKSGKFDDGANNTESAPEKSDDGA